MAAQTIARAARAAGVNVETIRYYERRGLIDRPRTVGTSFRVYPDETITRIGFIKRAQKLGFTLKEIRELLGLRAGSRATSASVRKRVEVKIAGIEEKLQDLKAMRRTLAELLGTCTGQGTADDCPILKSLDEDGPPRRRKPPTHTRRRQS
ncbi:MAG: MerR family DNA-binding protein [Planctomycetota bacterium]